MNAARIPERLLSRTYTDQADGMWTDFPSPWPEPFFSTCGYCGWDGPCRDTRAEAERDRWRHPNLLCWLRAFWIDYCSPRWGRRWRRA